MTVASQVADPQNRPLTFTAHGHTVRLHVSGIACGRGPAGSFGVFVAECDCGAKADVLIGHDQARHRAQPTCATPAGGR